VKGFERSTHHLHPNNHGRSSFDRVPDGPHQVGTRSAWYRTCRTRRDGALLPRRRETEQALGKRGPTRDAAAEAQAQAQLGQDGLR
jgi:hypothetical protein